MYLLGTHPSQHTIASRFSWDWYQLLLALPHVYAFSHIYFSSFLPNCPCFIQTEHFLEHYYQIIQSNRTFFRPMLLNSYGSDFSGVLCFFSPLFFPFGLCCLASQVALVVKSPPACAGHIRDVGLIPGSGRSPGGGHGNPLQYSCLENPMDRRAWWATVQGIPKIETGLKWLSMHAWLWNLSSSARVGTWTLGN